MKYSKIYSTMFILVNSIAQRGDSSSNPIPVALQILQDLLSSLPTFWSEAELIEVINLYLESCALDSATLSSLSSVMKTLSKRIPSKLLLPTICRVWSSVCGYNEVSNFYHVLRCLSVIFPLSCRLLPQDARDSSVY